MKSILGFLKKKEAASPREAVQRKFDHFMRLLAENRVALQIMAELEEKASGDYLFEREYVRLNVEALTGAVSNILHHLGELSGGRYPELFAVYQQVEAQVAAELGRRKEIAVSELTLPLEVITAEQTEIVGGKNAHLGEMKNRLGLPVPDGFAITAHAYRCFIERDGLDAWINERLAALDVNDFEATVAASAEIQARIRAQPLPLVLCGAVQARCDELTAKLGVCSIAVRSSAVGEGTESSFAGQYATVLNVPCKQVLDFYRQIVAGKFTPRALFYFINRGFRQEEIAMSVGCIGMIDAQASGVLYTVDPIEPNSDHAIINALWGLGRDVVEGTIPTDFFHVSKADKVILEEKIARKERMLVMQVGEGIREEAVPPEWRDQPSLTPEQIGTLVDYGRLLEEHYGEPQDVEWVLDHQEQIFLLQTRTLKALSSDFGGDECRETSDEAGKPVTRHPSPVTRHPSPVMLLDRGDRAAHGVGCGPVFLVQQDEDLARFPNGAVLVTRTSSPKFVAVMNKARAIVTDMGSAAGHMATLAREFQVPAMVNTGIATQVLMPGLEVTVDATRQKVYRGRVEELLVEQRTRKGIFKDTPAFAALQRILPHLVPLRLIDPEAEDFRPESCQSLHDLTRFAHQSAMQEMYHLAEETARQIGDAVRLRATIPLDVHVLDLGGGLQPGLQGRLIDPEAVVSIPMRAFWRGLTDMTWPEPRINAGGFLSVVAHTVADPELQQRLTENSLAILSAEYLNFSLRLGYHISTVEGLCTPNVSDNYVRLYFHGGAASEERRQRRARLVAQIVERYGFQVDRRGETVDALLFKCTRPELEEQMEMLGRLTVYTKQLDMTMFNDSIVDRFAEEFLKGNYS
jgi:pyruvate,water dikinase